MKLWTFQDNVFTLDRNHLFWLDQLFGRGCFAPIIFLVQIKLKSLKIWAKQQRKCESTLRLRATGETYQQCFSFQCHYLKIIDDLISFSFHDFFFLISRLKLNVDFLNATNNVSRGSDFFIFIELSLGDYRHGRWGCRRIGGVRSPVKV